MSELPEGWEEATLGDIASVQLGKMLDRAKHTRGISLPYLRNINVRWGVFDLSDLLRMPFQEDELEKFAIRRGDLLICEGGEPGRCAVWSDPDRSDLKFQKALLRVRPMSGIDPRWIRYAFQLSSFNGDLQSYFTGSTIKHFPRESAVRFRLSIPPLAEQRRIVKKVEALLARVRDARAGLNGADRVTWDLRASLLAKMCEQRQGWPSMALRDVTSDLRYGTAAKCDYDSAGVPVLRIPNVQSGKIDLSDVKYGPLSRDERRKLSLRKGDLLMVRSNGSVSLVGRTAVVSEAEQCFAFAGYLVRIRLDLSRVHPPFIHAYLQTPAMRQIIETTARSTSGVNNINSVEIMSLPVAIPSLSAQSEIAQVIANVDDHLERIRRRIDSASDRAEVLPQAILAKAFAGELVPTEAELARREGRNYEPASVLLERIRGERANAPAAPKRRHATATSASHGARSPRR